MESQEKDLLHWVRNRARQGINQARKVRKYVPRGPYTPVEQAALTALIAIEEQITIRDENGKNER